MNLIRSFRKLPPVQRVLLVLGILSFCMLYTLTLSVESDTSITSIYGFFITMCVVFCLCLCGLIARYILMMVRDKRERVFGSQIMRRLSLAFTLASLLPGLALLGMAAYFVTFSFRDLVGEDTKQALESGLELSRTVLQQEVAKSREQALLVRDNMVSVLMRQDDLTPAFATKQAQQFSVLAVWDLDIEQPVSVFNPQGQHLPHLNATTRKHLHRPNAILASCGPNMSNSEYIKTKDGQGRHYACGWLRLADVGDRHYALFYRRPAQQQVSDALERTDTATSKYKSLLYAREGWLQMYLLMLGLTALLTALLVVAAALYFSRRFVAPILYLAEGARAVAHGDFDRRITVIRKDELGKLTHLFNRMTEKLASAKHAEEQHRAEQEAARHYLERVLNSLSAGVVTFDEAGSLNTFNRSAETILDVDFRPLVGQTIKQWRTLSPKHRLLADTLSELLISEKHDQAIETAYTGADESRILLGKAIRLPEENGRGIVLVFDNITTLVLVQKEAAWREVAKRLAHEIRNPLTPIQLSAERLAWKLGGKLSDGDEKTLTKSTDTIIKQVAALKEMVEAFRNYARAPSLNLSDIDLNNLVAEVLVLYESTPCAFRAEFSKMPSLLKADTTAMRQVLHNLFKNAAEAAEAADTPEVHIRTEADEASGSLTLTVANNGKSFSKQMLQSAFEPYTTDKPTGTGLGLSVVRKIVEEHNGKITLTNQEGGGACVTLKFSTETL